MTAIELLRRLSALYEDGESMATSWHGLIKDTRAFLAEYDEAPKASIGLVFEKRGDEWAVYQEEGETDYTAVRIPVPRHLYKPETIDAEVVE